MYNSPGYTGSVKFGEGENEHPRAMSDLQYPGSKDREVHLAVIGHHQLDHGAPADLEPVVEDPGHLASQGLNLEKTEMDRDHN